MLPFPQIAPVISVISVINVINQCLQHCNLPVRWHAVRSLAHLQMITPITLMTVFQQTGPRYVRSEEHTSELQSHLNLVCRLLLEKKKKTLDHPTCSRLHTTNIDLLALPIAIVVGDTLRHGVLSPLFSLETSCQFTPRRLLLAVAVQ